jgi:hypothetical protein
VTRGVSLASFTYDHHLPLTPRCLITASAVQRLSRRQEESFPPGGAQYLTTTTTWQLANCVIQEVPLEQYCKIKMVCPIFLVLQHEQFRLIHDLRPLNKELLQPPSFRMEGWKEVAQFLKAGFYMAKLDHRKGYWQVRLSQDGTSWYLCFVFNKRVFRWLVLPFGLNWAPYIFTKLMRPVVEHLRSLGIFCVIYLDDLLLFGPSKDHVTSALETTLSLYETLGMIVNTEKSVLSPVQAIVYLGFDLVTVPTVSVALPNEKRLAPSGAQAMLYLTRSNRPLTRCLPMSLCAARSRRPGDRKQLSRRLSLVSRG